MSHWNVFSNHGHVLLFLARDPDARLRDVAASVGITERAVQKIMRDMQESGVISVSKHGRRNRYAIDVSAPLRHELESHRTVGDLIALIAEGLPTEPVGAPRNRPTAPPARPREHPRERPRVAPVVPHARSAEPPTQPAAKARSDGTTAATEGVQEAGKDGRPDRDPGRESPREPSRESRRKARPPEQPGSKGDTKPRSKRKPASGPPDDGEQGSLF